MRCWPLCMAETPQSQAPGKLHRSLSLSSSLPPNHCNLGPMTGGDYTGGVAYQNVLMASSTLVPDFVVLVSACWGGWTDSICTL